MLALTRWPCGQEHQRLGLPYEKLVPHLSPLETYSFSHVVLIVCADWIIEGYCRKGFKVSLRKSACSFHEGCGRENKSSRGLIVEGI